MDTTLVACLAAAVVIAFFATVTGLRRRRARLAAENRAAAAAHHEALQEHDRWKDRVVESVVNGWDDTVYDEFLNAPNDDARRELAYPLFARYILEDKQEHENLEDSVPFSNDWYFILMEDISNREQWELDWNAPVSSQRGQVLHYEVHSHESIASVNADYAERVAAHWVRREENERKRQEQNRQAEKDRQAAEAAKQKRIATAKKEWEAMSAAEKREFRSASKSRKIATLTSNGYTNAEATLMISDFSVHVPDSTPPQSSGSSFSGHGHSGSYDHGGGYSDGGGGDGGGGD